MSSNKSSSAKSECGEKKEEGVVFGKFWEKKISTFVKRVDLDKDGIISIKEFHWMADRYQDLSGCTEEKANELRNALNLIWRMCFEEAAKEQPVTAKVYCDALRKFGKDQLTLVVKNFFPHFFDVIDANGNGTIELEEYRRFLDIFGMDPNDAELAFTSLDENNDGVISREEFMKASLEFCTGDDEHSPCQYFLGRLLD